MTNIKRSLLLLLCLTSSTACALQGSAYFGLGLGADSTTNQTIDNYSLPPIAYSRQFSMSLAGATVAANLGYEFLLPHKFSIATEGFINVGTAEYTQLVPTLPQSNLTYQKIFDVGLRIQPAYQIDTNNQLFLSAGALASQFIITIPTAKPHGVSYHSIVAGYQLGLGINSAISSHVSLKTEYLYTQYNKHSAAETIPSSTVTETVLDHYTSQQYWLNVVYYFKARYQSPTPINNATNNFYIGITANSSNLRDNNNEAEISQASNIAINGLSGTIHAGYQRSITQHLGLGAELFYSTSNNSFQYIRPHLSEKNEDFNKYYNYGISLLTRYSLNSTAQAYFKLGGVMTKITHSGPGAIADKNTFSKDFPGLLLGLGYNLKLSQHLSLRTEYDLSIYKNLTIEGVNGLNSALYKFDFYDNTFSMGLDWNI